MNTETQLKNHILFTEHNATKEICSPILKPNVDEFAFARAYHDGSIIIMCTDLEWAEHCIGGLLAGAYPKNVLENHFIESGVSLSSYHLSNEIIQDAIHNFGFNSEISISKPGDLYTDYFSYISKEPSYKKDPYYLSNIDLLKKFNNYFLEKAGCIIKKGIKNKLILHEKYIQASTTNDRDVTYPSELETLLPENQFSTFQELTTREEQCIKLVAKGYYAKQVADELCLSRRTVEKYLELAKEKWQCSTLNELAYLYGVYHAN